MLLLYRCNILIIILAQVREEEKNMCKISEYPGLYMKAKEMVRTTKINPVMPGYEMLVKAIVICKVEGTDNIYNAVAKEMSVIPGQECLTSKEEERHPVKQMILEAMRSVGIEDDVKGFIVDLASQL